MKDLTWYHSIELPGGILTPGNYDTRRAAKRIPMPESLEGARCLDVGTADGFWAFEMERRGASEVIGLDLVRPADADWPGRIRDEEIRRADFGRGKACFEFAASALGSKVQRLERRVYDLSPEDVGSFDFVFLGALLLHLRDPIGALEAVASVTRGSFLCLDAVSVWLSLMHPWQAAARLHGLTHPLWWIPNRAALRQMIESAGFQVERVGGPFGVRYGDGVLRLPDESRLHRLGFEVLRKPLGSPHAWVLAKGPAA